MSSSREVSGCARGEVRWWWLSTAGEDDFSRTFVLPSEQVPGWPNHRDGLAPSHSPLTAAAALIRYSTHLMHTSTCTSGATHLVMQHIDHRV